MNGHSEGLNGWDKNGNNEKMYTSPMRKLPRVRFKVKIPEVAIQNPAHVLPPRLSESFRQWFQHDGWRSREDSGIITDQEARKEALTRARILEAGRPGGLLSVGKCSVYVPEEQEEPPPQWAHQDHLSAHAVYFKSLMDKEKRDHLLKARRLAYAAVAYLKEKATPSEEVRIAEQREGNRAKYKQTGKDLQRQWAIVIAEANRRRTAQWQEEQDALEKQALGQVLEQSKMLLGRRMRESSASVDEETDQASGEESSDEDSSNMSSTNSESEANGASDEVDADEGLTTAELRAKYANIPLQVHVDDDSIPDPETALKINTNRLDESASPDVNEEAEETAAQEENRSKIKGTNGIATSETVLEVVDQALLDDSNESTDMDDDTDDSEEDDENSDDDDSQGGEEGLSMLGFLSAKEVARLKEEQNTTEPNAELNGVDEDASMDDVALVPILDQGQSPSADILERNLTTQPEHHTVTTDAEIRSQDRASGEPSSQASLRTYATKRSEADSISSVEIHADSRHQSLPTTPKSAGTIKTPIPSLLRGTLREYQHFGLDWLANLYANHTNGILADEMGLGKTIQTIALLAHLAVEHEVWGPHLIVVPTSVMLNWEMEFKKWCPGFKILTYYGSQEERKLKRKGWMDDNRWHVCITSYQLVLQDQQTFKRRNWHYMVLDEAHNIKNFRSQRWQTLLTFKTRARLLLTGTPLQNNLTELWSLLFFLMPSDGSESGIAGFAGLKDFSDWFRKPVEQILEQGRETMDDEAKKTVSELHQVLRPFLLRRLKADVEKQMPGKYEHVVYCRLSKRQRQLYDGFMSRAQTRETLASGNYFSIVNCLMELRKVCNHPDLFETRPITTSFAVSKSLAADFEIKDLLVKRRLLEEDTMNLIDFDFLNLVPISREEISKREVDDSAKIMAFQPFQALREHQYRRTNWTTEYDGSSVHTALASMENAARKSRMDDLERCLYFESKRHGRHPIYGRSLIDLLTLDLQERPLSRQPRRRDELLEWFSNRSASMIEMVPSLEQRSSIMNSTIQKFACLTPAAVASDMAMTTMSRTGAETIREAQKAWSTDPFHEARMRLSIAFPDKRLLQYDCGKLQRLAILLRDLQVGGHRALIFTGMTKVLDILEQFLNIHGHRYLRLDGATKIEQRQILTDRFNNDPRILAFILSTRSGGLGINLTGADTVIFYDIDWNPAMDKQCQDRCHRIGQTRDVHIYRFVSEYTIESNILRKSNQKRMLDDVVIQEGEFTTDYFNKLTTRDILGDDLIDGDAMANAAMDTVLGAGNGGFGRLFEQVEDKEDIAAAKIAEKEIEHADEADFEEKTTSNSQVDTPKTPGPQTPKELMPPPAARAGTPTSTKVAADDTREGSRALESSRASPGAPMDVDQAETVGEAAHIDDYLIRFVDWELKDVPIVPPIDKSKKKSKKGQDHRVKRPR